MMSSNPNRGTIFEGTTKMADGSTATVKVEGELSYNPGSSEDWMQRFKTLCVVMTGEQALELRGNVYRLFNANSGQEVAEASDHDGATTTRAPSDRSPSDHDGTQSGEGADGPGGQ